MVAVGSYLYKPPDRITLRVPVKHMAHPSPGRVIFFANREQHRWDGPSIIGRLTCESGLSWAATNGQYQGLGQFGSVWGSMWSGTPRDVRWRTVKQKRKPVVFWTLFSDGTKQREVVAHKRVTLRVIHRGHLPENPSPYHGLAAIRVASRAVSGDGPTTYWACVSSTGSHY